MVELRPFLGVDGAGEGLGGGSISWMAKTRLPLRETLGTYSTSLTLDIFLSFIAAGRINRRECARERMHPCQIKEAGGEKKLPISNHT